MSKARSDFRIAIRTEGDWVVGYFAAPNTMDGALELARLKRGLLEGRDDPAFHHFQEVLRLVVTRIAREQGLETGDWTTVQAPEHEQRVGDA